MNGDEGNSPAGGQVIQPDGVRSTAPTPPDPLIRTSPVYTPPAAISAPEATSPSVVQSAAQTPALPPETPAPGLPQDTPVAPATQALSPEPQALSPDLPANQDMELPAEDFEPVYDEDGKDMFGQRDPTVVEWKANEFIQHHKSIKWYAAMVGGFVVAAVLAFLLTKDKITAITLVIIGIMLAILGARKPRELNYRLDADGLKMGTDKEYGFNQFRSFALMEEHDTQSVSFYPLQRFMPLITVYFDSSQEERIVEMLSNHLPMEERTHDAIDRLLHKIKL